MEGMYFIPVILILLLAALVLNTLRFRKKISVVTDPLPFELSEESVDKLKRAISIKTVSHSDYGKNDLREFGKIIPFIRENYPLVSEQLGVETLNPYSCFIRWKGTDESLKPILLISHFDVVPAVLENWSSDPFGGELKEGYIWGRGTLDTKNTMTAILEAAEQLLSRGFTPARSIYMAFGGDEETQGTEGAAAMCRYFREEGIEFQWLLDEGGVVAENSISLVKEPLALVGIAEKGFVNLTLKSIGTGGHSSMPPAHTAAGLLAKAITNLEKNPFPSKITPALQAFLKGISPYVSFPVAVILANNRIFSPLIRKLFLMSPQTAALVRTTQAVTILRSGEKENVLPSEGEAVVNCRILPGETVDSVYSRVAKLLQNEEVTTEILKRDDSNDPIEESSIESEGYKLIGSVIHGIFPGSVTVPYMMSGATDSKHYQPVCENIYRFSPMSLSSDEITLIHSADERISIENYSKAIQFYMTLINEL